MPMAGISKVRSTLNKVRPVTLAMEAAVRFWHSVGRARMLGNAVKVSERQFPRLHGIVDRCAQVLQIDPPALYVSPKLLPPGGADPGHQRRGGHRAGQRPGRPPDRRRAGQS